MKKKLLCILLFCSMLLNFVCSCSVLASYTKISHHKQTQTYTVTMKAVGDCLTHKELYKAANTTNNDYDFSMYFKNIKSDIASADLSIINQETIFTYNPTNYSGYPQFATPTQVGDAIADAGFDIVCHATNHVLDRGIQGILDTLSFWKKYPRMKILGIHRSASENDVVYLRKNNIKFAFVNYTILLNGRDQLISEKPYMVDCISDSDVDRTLKKAERNADLTVAILHIGREYIYRTPDYVKKTVDRFINNGADIVICNHPHVVNPYEKRTTSHGKSGIVFYSLGNFISGQKYIPRIIGGMANIKIKKRVFADGTKRTFVSDYSMEPLITHQEIGYYTTYKLSDYRISLWKKHLLYSEDFPTITSLKKYFSRVMKGKQRQNRTGLE